MFPLSEFN